MLQRRQRVAGQIFNDARDRIQRAVAFFSKKLMKVVMGQRMLLGLKTGSAVGDLFSAKRAHVALENHQVFALRNDLTVALNTSRKLNKRTHGARLDNPPVGIKIAPDFKNGGSKHDKEVVLFR
ncbi:Uncharacterised protein [Enterobacter cloacae]|nr:Uncharacterised protein [Enterobacter cloacae]